MDPLGTHHPTQGVMVAVLAERWDGHLYGNAG